MKLLIPGYAQRIIQEQEREIEELNRLLAQAEMRIEELEAALEDQAYREEPPR